MSAKNIFLLLAVSAGTSGCGIKQFRQDSYQNLGNIHGILCTTYSDLHALCESDIAEACYDRQKKLVIMHDGKDCRTIQHEAEHADGIISDEKIDEMTNEINPYLRKF